MNTNTTLTKGSWIQLNERRAAGTGSLLWLLLLLLLPATVQAQFNYTTNNGTITITKYTGPGGAVTIPDTITGLPVTSIGGQAFYQCTNLTSVTIPDSVTSIQYWAFITCTNLISVTIGNGVTNIADQAFASCTGLTNFTFPNSLISIGKYGFAGCSSLTSITIPNGVISIGERAFGSCTSLTAITVDPENTHYNSVAGVLCNISPAILLAYPPGKAGSYAIPEGITSIGDHALRSCSNLTSVTIPDSVTNIGPFAFANCTNLTSVTIGNGVTSIGGWVFDFCTSLTNVTIPNSVTSIASYPFEGCNKLTSVTIPNSVTNLGTGAFASCGLTSVTIPNSVTNLGTGAFAGCAGLTSVVIPNSVTSIGQAAFTWCAGLTNVMIGNSVTSIGQSAFGSCSNLANVTIGGSVTDIGGYAFQFCTSLTNVTIPSSVTRVEDGAFRGCPSLAAFQFNGNAPSLGGSSVFTGDINATVYYLPGTTGWGTTFGGLPAVLWDPPAIQASPQSQTAEAGSAVGLRVKASGVAPLFCLWYLNDTNFLSCSTNCALALTDVQFAQSGAYTVVVSNVLGAVISAPVMLNVIAAVERRPVPGVKLVGEAGSLLNVDYADSLSPAPTWTTLGSVNLTSTSQYWFDLTLPLPPQRFYRAWQTGTPWVRPSLDLHLVPAITLTGDIGHFVRVDYINRFGPTDAWVTLDTVTLTNTSQLYFDVSAPGQPQRLYRLVPLP